jgi:C1A family cysteine protease
MNTKKYTWKPDLPDHRDHIFMHTGSPIPDVVDLRDKCPTIVDQGQLGSCTGNALAGAMGFIHSVSVAFSRLFIYFNERSIEGTIKQDAGAMIRDGIKSIANLGVCTELTWPYNIAKFKSKPSAKSYKEAAKTTISSYQRLTTLDDMLQCLAAGFPFVFGFTVYEGFESADVAKTGIVNMPTAKEKALGGHAVMAVGYDKINRRILVRNSWGDQWGQKGYFTLPFDYLTRKLSDDFWTIRK